MPAGPGPGPGSRSVFRYRRASLLFAGGPELFGPQAAFPGCLGRHRRSPRALNPQRLVEPLGEAFQRDLTVAGLGTLVAGHYPEGRPQAFEHQGALARTEDARVGYVENQLDPGVGGVGVLASWASAGAEAPFQLGRRDHQSSPSDSQAVPVARRARAAHLASVRSSVTAPTIRPLCPGAGDAPAHRRGRVRRRRGWLGTEAVDPALEVTLLPAAGGAAKGNLERLPGRHQVSRHLEQVPANRVQPVVLGHPFVVVERGQER